MNSSCSKIILELKNKITSTDDLEYAISLAEVLAKLLWSNNVGVYSFPDIETYLLFKVIDSIGSSEYVHNKNNDILFVISEPYLAGGHTRLMERLSEMLDEDVDLLITRRSGDRERKRMSSFFFSVITIPSSLSTLNKIEHISDIYAKYNKLILNIHPDDIISVLSCGLAKKKNPDLECFFINHADHVFNVGVTVADIWFEISNFGRKIDKLRGITCPTSFLGIPLDKNTKFDSENIRYPQSKNEIKKIVSAASGAKFKPIKGVSIFPTISELLVDYPHAIIYIIGVNFYTDYWWWPVKLKHLKRLKIIKSLPYSEYLSLTKDSDLYIDSHPMPGGTAFVEQCLNGVYCTGIESPLQGYTPLEENKRKAGRSGFSINNLEMTMDKIEAVHSFYKVRERFLNVIRHMVCSSNLLESYEGWSGNEHFLEKKDVDIFPFEMLSLSLRDSKLITIMIKTHLLIFIKSVLVFLVRKVMKK
ncbi:hypothetical protein [Aeromonas salmonicida]|uniref:hypothetical protein n=1 Tax=Aeromonas salmonicida TaxID=645 RepID=UPI0024A9A8F8|nr:hypothetical protein [Aeromonas salmonicida]MDM5135569.1 hypothetical protein [Aeromonas salmonicida]WHF41666.1 hypothetical protein QJ050_02495 [Aeromonas salmonicida]